MKKSSEFSTEAGLKYFVLGTFISGFLLMALSFFFVAFGNLNMDVIKRVDFLLFDYLLEEYIERNLIINLCSFQV